MQKTTRSPEASAESLTLDVESVVSRLNFQRRV